MKRGQMGQKKIEFHKVFMNVASTEKFMEKSNKVPQAPQSLDTEEEHITPPPAMELAPSGERFWFAREPWAFRTAEWPDRIWLLTSPPSHFTYYDRKAGTWSVIDRRFDFAVIPPQKTLPDAMRVFFKEFRGAYPSGRGWFRQLMQNVGITLEDYVAECHRRYLPWWCRNHKKAQ